jgi:hypothetical protein
VSRLYFLLLYCTDVKFGFSIKLWTQDKRGAEEGWTQGGGLNRKLEGKTHLEVLWFVTFTEYSGDKIGTEYETHRGRGEINRRSRWGGLVEEDD